MMNFIRSVYNDFGAIIDTHTADGIKAAMAHSIASNPMIVLETALPIKFEKSVFESIGVHPKRPHTLKDLELLQQKFEVFENNAELVKKYITDNT